MTPAVWTALSLGALAALGGPAAAAPWEVWRDLRTIAALPPRDQVLLRSSYCPGGCRFDRHSAGDSRFLYLDGEEGVIFDEPGAGAVTRIWATMGSGTSEPLDPAIRVRIYVDGQTTPVVDLPLPALFDGSTAPFLPPLVADRLVSSGGNVSYVPIPYRRGCRIALIGAEQKRIWFQIGFHRLAESDGVESFTGSEDLAAWAALLDTLGADPWPLAEAGLAERASTIAESLVLAPGEAAAVASLPGPDLLTALRVRAAPSALASVEIRLAFDGEERVRMPLADFFAVGRAGMARTRSLFFGLDDEGFLYAYPPMPFFAAAEISLTHLGAPEAAPVALVVEVRRDGRAPPAGSGIFGAELRVNDPTTAGVDAALLALEGHGKWFGLFAELGSVGTRSRQYLEGDERVYLDGSPHPAVYGTGVEDFFNGGFYFDRGPFLRALHGSPYHLGPAEAGGEDVTAAYRWMPTDAITFASALSAGLESGPSGSLPMRARTVAYYYLRPESRLETADVLDLGDAASRAAHAYEVEGTHDFVLVDSFFEGEPPVAHRATSVERPPGVETFRLRPKPGDTLLRLRRRFDASFAGQSAEISAGGAVVARFPVTFPNPLRRWQEIEVDLPAAVAPGDAGEVAFEVTALPGPGDLPAGTFTAGTYELLSGRPVCRDSSGPLRIRSTRRGFILRGWIDEPAGTLGALDPRDGLAITASNWDGAVHVRIPAGDPGWGRSLPETGRYVWRGALRGILTVSAAAGATRGWYVLVRGRDVPGAESLGADPRDATLQIEIGTECFGSAP
jgi:hypothetical protein